MGEALADVVKRAVQPMDIDVVIPVRLGKPMSTTKGRTALTMSILSCPL